MKKVLVISGSLACLLLTSCGLVTSEPDTVARQYWDRMGRQCGDGYYMNVAVTSLSLWLTGDSLRGVKGLTEFRGFAHVQTEDTLTDADRLNGLTWSGRTWLIAGMYRSWGSGRWSQWYDAQGMSRWTSESLFKKNGLWFYGAGGYQGATIDSFRFPEPVDCAKVPK